VQWLVTTYASECEPSADHQRLEDLLNLATHLVENTTYKAFRKPQWTVHDPRVTRLFEAMKVVNLHEAGDPPAITYDLVMQLKMQPVEGDNTLEGKEEDLKFYTDSLYIDQVRGGVNTGGAMTRKRTLHNLRQIARARQSDWWARVFDELIFMYGSGARGVNTEFIFPKRGIWNEQMKEPEKSPSP
jgi:hypothetical protein